MTSPAHDPAAWPLAPGNASPETEQMLAAQTSRWPEPTTAFRELVTGILSRPGRRTAATTQKAS